MKDNNLIYWTQFIYILFTLLWILLVLVLELYNHGIIVLLLLMIPPIIFASGYYVAPSSRKEDEDCVFEASFLAIGLLVLMPLVNWMKTDYKGDCRYLVKLILTGIILTLFSVLDIWLKHHLMRLNKHIRLCFETMAVILFMSILVIFYQNSYLDGLCS